MRNPWCLAQLAAAADDDADDGIVGRVPATGQAGMESHSEWPTPEELERAAEENAAWSADAPAAARYRRFREENFARLRLECARAAGRSMAPSDRNVNVVEPAGRSGATGGTAHSGWYAEWSQASTRRRHLDRKDDAEQRASAGGLN